MSLPAYMQIRMHILGLIENRDRETDKIASERELCRQFQVCRSTVRKALKDLVDDGYLLPQLGMGTFINPDAVRNFQAIFGDKTHTVGITIGDGRPTHFDHYYWHMVAEIGKALVDRGALVRIIYLVNKTDRVAEELSAEGIDGLVWVSPNLESMAMLRGLSGSGLKIVCVNRHPEIEGVGVVFNDYVDNGRRAAGYFLDRHRHRLICAGINSQEIFLREAFEGFSAGLAERGVEFRPGYNLCRLDQLEADLEKIIELGCEFDGIFVAGFAYGIVARVLQRHKIRVPEDCAVVTFDGTPLRQYPLPGVMVVGKQTEEIAAAAAADIMARIEGRSLTPVCRAFTPELENMSVTLP